VRLQKAEYYLKERFPEAMVPKALLKQNLLKQNESLPEPFREIQGELMGLGITRYARVAGTGRQIGGQWKRFCIAFPSGEYRTQVSTSLFSDQIDGRYWID
jgi:hypothetical protein